MFRKILVANDGSPAGERALKHALELAKRLEVDVTMICVEQAPRVPTSIGEIKETQALAVRVFDEVVASAEALARSHDVHFEAHVLVGRPVPSIVEFVKEHGFDLLVIGHVAHATLYDRIVASVTVRLVEHPPCKILVIN